MCVCKWYHTVQILHLFKCFPDLGSFYVFPGFEGITFYLLDSLSGCLAFCFCRSKPTVVIFVYFSWCRSGPFFPPRNVMLSGLFACSPRRNKPHAFLGQSTIHLSRVIKKWPSSFSGPELIWIILKEGWMHIGISRFYVSIV